MGRAVQVPGKGQADEQDGRSAREEPGAILRVEREDRAERGAHAAGEQAVGDGARCRPRPHAPRAERGGQRQRP
jgi:hypothetical protein